MARPFVVYLPQGAECESLLAGLRKRGVRVHIETTLDALLARARAEAIDTVLLPAKTRSTHEAKKIRGRVLAERSDVRVAIVHDLHAGRSRERGPRWRFSDLEMNDDELLRLLDVAPRALPVPPGSTEGLAIDALTRTVDLLVGLHEIGDEYFASSSHRTMRLAADVARQMGLDEDTQKALRLAALLRDVGKVGVDQSVFDEPGELDESQREEMKTHVDATLRLLAHVEFPWQVKPIIRHHHERFDGRGYPDGLKGPEIPVGARILAAVEAFLAMTSERAHRDATSAQSAIAELTRETGSQFDPEVVEALLKSLQEREIAFDVETQPRALLVDRDREFVRCLKMQLTNQGMQVRTVRPPSKLTRRAMTRFLASRVTKYRPHLIVFAVQGDGAEGLESRRGLQKSPAARNVPFVFLADTDDRVLRIRALREGIDGFLTKSDDLEELVAALENVLVRERLRHGAPSERVRGIHGSLVDLGVADIVQMQTMGLKTARVEFRRGDERGALWFREGRAVHAEAGDATAGRDAFFSLLEWNEGSFRIEHGQESPTVTLEVDSTFLLMEGLRRIDERNAGLDDEAATG